MVLGYTPIPHGPQQERQNRVPCRCPEPTARMSETVPASAAGHGSGLLGHDRAQLALDARSVAFPAISRLPGICVVCCEIKYIRAFSFRSDHN